MPKPWRGAKTADAWAAALLPFGAKLGLAAVADDDAAQQLSESLQRRFVEAAQRHEAYGAHFFVTRKKDYDAMPDVVRALPRELVIGLNATGLFVYATAAWQAQGAVAGEALGAYGFADIQRWGGSSSTFSLYVKDASAGAVFELRLTTGQAPDIAAVILDYINAIMEAS